MDLAGCSAIVTGAASGLGAATARALSAAGAKVVGFDLNGSDVVGDVADEAALRAAVDRAASLAPLRVAVSCAGIAPAARVLGRSGAHELALFERVLRVNLLGSFNLLRLAAARMAELPPVGADGERGVIINTGSIAAEDGQTGQVAYAASKGGVAAMTLPAARELARHGIRVVTIAPGLMETPLMASLPPEAVQKLRALPPFPSGRLGKPEEFAALVLHACENALLNGCVLRLDAALRMPP